MEERGRERQAPPDEGARFGRGAFGSVGADWDTDPPGGRAHDAHRAREGRGELECVEFCPICRTADVLRAAVPEEFQGHWRAWQREMLLAVRSLLDHYLDHIEAERGRRVQVEDIPIE